MTLGGQIRTSVRSVQAVGVSPKALSRGGPGWAGAPPGLLDVRFGKKQKEQKAESIPKSHYVDHLSNMFDRFSKLVVAKKFNAMSI